MKKYNYIYLITNNTNGKIYIGQHRTDDLDDGYMGSGTLLLMAKQKYGIKNFSKEIIAYADTKEKLDYLERFYIRKYKAQNKNIGYNIQPGGGGYGGTKGMHFVFSEEHKQKLSEAQKRYCQEHGAQGLGKHLSNETKKKISEAHKGKQVWNKGIPHSEETKRKISEALKNNEKIKIFAKNRERDKYGHFIKINN